MFHSIKPQTPRSHRAFQLPSVCHTTIPFDFQTQTLMMCSPLTRTISINTLHQVSSISAHNDIPAQLCASDHSYRMPTCIKYISDLLSTTLSRLFAVLSRLRPSFLHTRCLWLPLTISLASVLTACDDDIDRVLFFASEVAADDVLRTICVALLSIKRCTGICTQSDR